VIDFRYHLVSIIAVFMALAVGIVLGAGPLQGPIETSLQGQATDLIKEKDQLRERISELQRSTNYGEDFAETLAPQLVGNQLGGVDVVLVNLPGADRELAEQLESMLELAGAQVHGSVRIADAYLEDDQRAVLDRLVASLVPPGVDLPGDGTTYERAAVALAASVLTEDSTATGQAFQAGADVLSGLEELDLLDVDGEPWQRSSLALVVAPPVDEETDAPNDAAASDQSPLVALVGALDAASRGAVLASPTSSATEGGVLAQLRSTPEVADGASSVDVADSAGGQVATVLALAEQLRGDNGHYGAGPDTDGPLPELAGAAAP